MQNNQSDLHHIQRSIILSLAIRSPQRFSELQPARIPNNTFSYHLKKLIDTGYIESTPSGYVTTRKALKLISIHPNNRTKNPVSITMVYVTNDAGEVLLINRNKRPFKGWYSLPSGMIHLGESVDVAAQRELTEKTSIEPTTTLTPVGVLDFQYKESITQDIFVHALAFIFTYHIKGDTSYLNDLCNSYGQLSWSQLGRSHILPEVWAVKEMYEANQYSHRSIVFDEPEQVPSMQLKR